MADFTFAHREEGFDEHIEHSIRGYSNLLDDVVQYSRYFVEDDTNVVDIGCSTGKFTQMMLEANQDFCCDAHYIGVEIAEGFHNDLLKRQENINKLHPWASTEFLFEDVRDYEFENCSLITSIFTLQFMPPRHRQEVIRRIYEGLNTGGAFIFGEKTVCQDPRLQNMMTFNYYDYKRKNFDTEDIMDKEKTLRHMMKPNTWDEIVNNLIEAGFWGDKIQPFWRNHTFVGAIAIK
jgi:tRNA (cmo5U34)-methyltransferase